MNSKYLNIMVISIIFGYIYYMNMVKSIKDECINCSFVTNKLTDVIAFIIGFILINKGIYLYDDDIITIIGITIIIEHILQFSYKL